MTPVEIAQAACRGHDTNLWFPLDLGNERFNRFTAEQWKNRPTVRAAIDICNRCPVRIPCRDEAVHTGETSGIRGGLTPPELRQLRACPCGTVFQPHQRTQRYCTMTCSERARRGRHVDEKVA